MVRRGDEIPDTTTMRASEAAASHVRIEEDTTWP
jgi:hypothetical protein